MRSVGLTCVLSICLVAAATLPTPLQYTRSVLEQAQAVVAGTQTHNEKLAALASLFGNFLDTDQMGKEAVGKRWDGFTPPQQKRFLILFRRLFERTYVDTLLLFEKPEFAYVGETQFHGEVRVDTKIITPHDQFAVGYQLRPDGDRWMATNVKVENVNLTANLANQLDHLLSRSSADDVLDLMQRKYGDSAGLGNRP
jgi:phospholipid transport system substrate-binding protein